MYSLYLRYIISYIVNNNAKSAIFSPKVSMITNVIFDFMQQFNKQ